MRYSRQATGEISNSGGALLDSFLSCTDNRVEVVEVQNPKRYTNSTDKDIMV